MKKLIACLLFALPLLANEPSIQAELASRNAFLGDAVLLTVRITHQQDETVDPFEPAKELGEASVLSHTWKPASTEEGANPNQTVLEMSLAWYRLGEHKVPPMDIEVKGPTGSTTLTTPEITLEIINMLTEEDQAAAPPKGQVDLEVPMIWPWIIGAALVLLACLALVIYWLLHRRKQVEETPPPPPKPPYEEAIESLNELTAGSLLKEGRVKEFYVAVNLVVRHYYARLFDVQAEEMTSFELECWMEDNSHLLPGELFYLNRAFQEQCDRVKFAKHDPVEAENKETTNRAYQLVEMLRHASAVGKKEEPDVAVG